MAREEMPGDQYSETALESGGDHFEIPMDGTEASVEEAGRKLGEALRLFHWAPEEAEKFAASFRMVAERTIGKGPSRLSVLVGEHRVSVVVPRAGDFDIPFKKTPSSLAGDEAFEPGSPQGDAFFRGCDDVDLGPDDTITIGKDRQDF